MKKKKKKGIVTQRNLTFGHPLKQGHDTKTNWPTDRRSQYNLLESIRLSENKMAATMPLRHISHYKLKEDRKIIATSPSMN
jgi:hypothetical protein